MNIYNLIYYICLIQICYGGYTYNIGGWCPHGSFCAQYSGSCSSYCEKGCEMFSPTPHIYPYTTICLNTTFSEPIIGIGHEREYISLSCPYGIFNNYLDITKKYQQCPPYNIDCNHNKCNPIKDVICWRSVDRGIVINLPSKLLNLVNNITCKFNSYIVCNVYSHIQCN